jgi:hypothetical protein
MPGWANRPQTCTLDVLEEVLEDAPEEVPPNEDFPVWHPPALPLYQRTQSLRRRMKDQLKKSARRALR